MSKNHVVRETGEVIRHEGIIYCDEPMLTQQSAKEECDINLIVERAKRGADISHLSKAAPKYGDFTGLPDYRESLLMVTKAREMFMSLDAFVRERFSNDPGRLLDFLANPENRDEAVKLGLMKPRVEASASVPEALAEDLGEEPGASKKAHKGSK